MEDADLEGLRWRKSTYSENGGANCVEVGQVSNGTVLVRDTHDRSGPVLGVGLDEWARFAAGLKTVSDR